MPTYYLPVWKFEHYVKQSLYEMQQICNDNEYYRLIRDHNRGLFLSHLLYWTLPDEEAGIIVCLPTLLNDNDRRYADEACIN